jgi:hypothetical protein
MTRSPTGRSAAASVLSAFYDVDVATDTPQQSAAQELLAELFGVDVQTSGERGEDYFTAHPDRRRPTDRPYTLPPRGDGVPEELVWHHVDSSNVDTIAYDVERRQLYVRFLNGGLYRYDDFPPTRWADFLASNSKGLFVWHVIRGNGSDDVFSFEKLN